MQLLLAAGSVGWPPRCACARAAITSRSSTVARDSAAGRKCLNVTGFVMTPVYDRDKLPVNARISGPAIVEQMDTTTVVPPRAKMRNDKLGYLHIEVEPLHIKGAS